MSTMLRWLAISSKSELAELAYVALFVVKMLTFLALQFLYTACQNNMRSNLASEPSPAACSADYYRLLAAIGSNYRLLRGAAIFPYTFYILVGVIKYFCQFFIIPRYVQLQDNDFYLFLTRPLASRARIRERLDKQLDELIASNRNYLQSMACLHYFDLDHAEKLNGNNDNTNQLVLERFQRHRERRRRQLVLAIQSQHCHLINLKQKMAPIWPQNRQSEAWRRQAQQMSVAALMAISIGAWLTLVSVALIIHREAINQHRLKGLPFTWLDHLHLAEQLVYTVIYVRWYSGLLGFVIVSQLDQLRYLGELRARSKRVLDELLEAKLEDLQSSARKQLGKLDPGGRSLPIGGQFWCDKGVLELYISFRHFSRELKSALNCMGLIVSQGVAIGAGILIAQLGFVKTMELFEVKLSSFDTLVTLSLANVLLIMAAAFNAQCLRINKLVWSCIGAPQIYAPLEAAGGGGGGGQVAPELVTPHTLLLWRRLNTDHLQTVDRHSCKLFGSIRISYTLVLQLNFWAISAVILVKSTDFFS